MANDRGFSLIELLIVVGIILIIAAIALPNLVRSRIAANDSAAASAVRSINTAEATYQSSYPLVGYTTLASLGPGGAACAPGGGSSANACILDSALGCPGGASGVFCPREQFKYTVTVNNNGADYVVFAAPLSANQGDADYCAVPDMVIRRAPDPSATGAAPTTDSACTSSPYTPI